LIELPTVQNSNMCAPKACHHLMHLDRPQTVSSIPSVLTMADPALLSANGADSPEDEPFNYAVLSNFDISPEDRLHGRKQVEELLKQQRCDTTSPKIQIVGNTRDIVGTDKSQQTTIDRCEQIWEGAKRFCCLTGEHESAIIFNRDICPANPPPMGIKVATNFLRFRHMEKGTIVRDAFTQAPVTDRHGTILVARGDWKGGSVQGLCRSALSKVHSHCESTSGTHREACEACCALGIEALCKGHGCIQHPGKPQGWRSGCVTKNTKFKDEVSKAQDCVENHCVTRSTCAFIPGQLREMWQHLISKNDLHSLMIWTMLIVGIKLFMRMDEVVTMKVEDFLMACFVATASSVEGLCVEICGKKETAPKKFMAWDDKDCPEFSPSKAILIWLAVSGIKSGYMFPTLQQLHAKATAPTEHCTCRHMLSFIKHLVFDVLKEDPSDPTLVALIIGTHMLRKTGFLLACWGFMLRGKCKSNNSLLEPDQAALLLSARHESVASMANCISDSGTMKELIDRIDAGNPDHHVGEWKPIHVKTCHNFARINMKSAQHQQALPDLARWWLVDVVGLPPNFKEMSVSSIHRHVNSFQPDLSVKAKINELLNNNVVDPTVRNELFNLIQAHNTETVMASIRNHPALLEQPAPAVGSRVKIAGKRKAVPDDKQVQLSCSCQAQSKEAGKDKKMVCVICVEAVKEAQEQVKAGKTLANGPLKGCLCRAGRVADCIAGCCFNDMDSFLQNNTCPLSQFCCRNGSTCANNKEHKANFNASTLQSCHNNDSIV